MSEKQDSIKQDSVKQGSVEQGSVKQDSVNYPIILAVVTLLSLAIIFVLGGYNDVKDSGPQLSSRAYWKMADIGIVDWNVSGSTVNLVIKNNRQHKIKLNYVSVGGRNMTAGLGVELNKGSQQSVSGEVLYCRSGSEYSYNVSIGYADTKNSIPNLVFTGTQDIMGTC